MEVRRWLWFVTMRPSHSRYQVEEAARCWVPPARDSMRRRRVARVSHPTASDSSAVQSASARPMRGKRNRGEWPTLRPTCHWRARTGYWLSGQTRWGRWAEQARFEPRYWYTLSLLFFFLFSFLFPFRFLNSNLNSIVTVNYTHFKCIN
jgi:hypothetical protein